MSFELSIEHYEAIFCDQNPMLCFQKIVDRLQASSDEPISTEALLNTPLKVNVLVDTGDSCSEFTMNTLSPSWVGKVYGYNEQIHNSASIAWLTRQQGYTKKELSSYLQVIDDEYERQSLTQGFLYSAAYEIWHELSEMNILSFLVTMKLKDLILLETLRNWTCQTKDQDGYILLDKNTTTGFYDPWNGSGSLMKITLEKDVKLPIKYINYANPDCIEHHSIARIWQNPTMWDGDGVKLIHLPQKFRKDMNALGIDKSLIDPKVSDYILDQ